MFFFLVSFLAGVLTVLAPCILPLLPIVLGTSEESGRGISRKSIVIISSLSVSVIVFTLLLKASTLLIDIPQSFWNYFSGTIIILVALAILFPSLWSKFPLVSKVHRSSNQALGTGFQKKNFAGDILIGASLGPVFTTCSPTYLFIIATILPASLVAGLAYLIGFTLGLALSLLLIAYFGGQIIERITKRMGTADLIKQLFGILILIVGVAIFTGYDKVIETKILDSGYGATIDFEQRLIDSFEPEALNIENKDNSMQKELNINIPNQLERAFPNTDWSKADPRIEGALSGGPGKDGIPALDDPMFVPIDTFAHADSVLAIVIKDGESARVYPYNILNWHEIVNDTVEGVPVAVTFCPLCGSAIVFNRDVEGSATTFGVSGSLLESNMIMYDRDTESLWQQSTGKVLAGERFGTELELIPFQLMTIAEVQEKYPHAKILSEDTGYRRNYARNPYVGYTENDTFIFSPSKQDTNYHPKEIMVVYKLADEIQATPWESLLDGEMYETALGGTSLTLRRTSGEVSITDAEGEIVPFYIEMWFSYAVQHGEDGDVFDPRT